MTPLVVFLRGVNVGGNKKFSPAALARDMEDFGVVNVGAAGTFVVRRAPGAAALRAEIAKRLPFEAEAIVCTGKEILGIAASDPFSAPPKGAGDVREMVTILAKEPKPVPRLPIRRPPGADWQVDLFRVDGRFAFAFWRPGEKRGLYIDPQKDLGVSGTARTWKTIQKICGILAG